jgi:tRNA threonylcarbamoyladenosine biosynthesis protein TsaE
MELALGSVEETFALGRALAGLLDDGTVVMLQGPLGAGKTVCAKGIASGLGISEPVTSPTFAVVQEYQRPAGGWLYHLDMYRIADESAALAFGIEEYLYVPDAITVIEWPERVAALLATAAGGRRTVQLHFRHADQNCRGVAIPGWLASSLINRAGNGAVQTEGAGG